MKSLDSEIFPDVCASPLHLGFIEGEVDETIVYVDCMGLPWCASCQHRGRFLDWGAAHGWPALEYAGFALAQGQYYWHITATQADDERAWSLLSYAEALEQEGKVA